MHQNLDRNFLQNAIRRWQMEFLAYLSHGCLSRALVQTACQTWLGKNGKCQVEQFQPCVLVEALTNLLLGAESVLRS